MIFLRNRRFFDMVIGVPKERKRHEQDRENDGFIAYQDTLSKVIKEVHDTVMYYIQRVVEVDAKYQILDQFEIQALLEICLILNLEISFSSNNVRAAIDNKDRSLLPGGSIFTRNESDKEVVEIFLSQLKDKEA